MSRRTVSSCWIVARLLFGGCCFGGAVVGFLDDAGGASLSDFCGCAFSVVLFYYCTVAPGCCYQLLWRLRSLFSCHFFSHARSWSDARSL